MPRAQLIPPRSCREPLQHNEDHAILTAKNVLAGERVYDIWNVNEDAGYHEAGGACLKEALGSERLVPQKAKETAAA